MIALRGTIRHKSGTGRRSPSTSPTPSTSDFDIQTTQPGEWIWTGYWAFGSLPPAEVLDGVGLNRKKKPPNGVRPFVYKFQEFKEAKDVVVPSSLVMSDDDTSGDGDGDVDGDGEGDRNTNGNPDNDEGKGEMQLDTKDTNVTNNANESNDVKTLQPADEKEGNDDTPMSKTDVSKQEGNEIVNQKSDRKIDDKDDAQKVVMDSIKEADVKAADKIDSLDKMEIDTKKQDRSDIKDVPIGVQQSKVEKPTKSDNSKHADNENVYGCGVEKKAQEEKEKKKVNESQKTKSEPEFIQGCSNVDSQTKKEKLRKTLSNTFAAVSGGTFTDAGKKNPKGCPIGGCWKGYFENVSKRKDRMSSRVQETFHLFFNSTPPSDARVGFIDEEDQGSVNSGGDLPSGQIHVRGAGTNQFGTFEILGGFDIVTGVLSCQRIYVSTSDSTEVSIEDKRIADEKDKATRGSPSRKPVRKSYFTRKRPVASWRTTSYGAYDDIYETGTGRSNSGRKRQRTTSEPSTKVINTAVGDTSGAPKSSDTSTQPAFSSSKTIGISSSVEPSVDRNISNEASTKVDIMVSTSTTRRPSPGKSPSSRKHRSSPSSTARSSPSVNSTAYQIKIPKSGNPLDARWRAAHFIYFQRHVESNESSSPTNTPVATTTNYVVYEGEMNSGKNLRDGRGVCLYNNGTLYEGEWKKNKEHGNGTLLTGDRKRIIYSGDWERGKMHGRGTYYYHMYANSSEEADPKNGGVYVGDFKENARHGVGTYTLPGGNVFSGDWRENVPCGKGIFTWFDNSKYDGMWKDGKRNGWGQLHCSDGFQYDGIWVDNAMEGRGRAVYPTGQQYDGMWLNGKRDGRGTIIFGNGAVYKGRFKEDGMEGQGTLKVDRNVSVSPIKKIKKENVDVLPKQEAKDLSSDKPKIDEKEEKKEELLLDDWMIPIEFQSDIGRIHEKAGFTTGGE